MRRVAIIGAGSWGTALAIHLARSGADAKLWARGERAATIRADGENRDYLPGHRMPDRLEVSGDLKQVLHEMPLVLFVIPAQASRDIFRQAAPYLESGAYVVIASKGIEQASGLRLSQVLAEELGPEVDRRCTVLSGPSFAVEVARGDPTAVVVGGMMMPAGGCRRLSRRPI